MIKKMLFIIMPIILEFMKICGKRKKGAYFVIFRRKFG